jgi:hypothetical protein
MGSGWRTAAAAGAASSIAERPGKGRDTCQCALHGHRHPADDMCASVLAAILRVPMGQGAHVNVVADRVRADGEAIGVLRIRR